MSGRRQRRYAARSASSRTTQSSRWLKCTGLTPALGGSSSCWRGFAGAVRGNEAPGSGREEVGSPFEAVIRWVRRGAGVVDRGGLENRCTPLVYRGFESHPLRQGSG